MKMHFDHLNKSNYTNTILTIIREGIDKCIQSSFINKTLPEDLITQRLCKEFIFIGMNLKNQKIGCFTQHRREDNRCSEDFCFFLENDERTEIFFAEAKCLPKPCKLKNKCFEKEKDEYVNGVHSSGSPSGGIQRYKLLKHGYKSIRENALIAYIKDYKPDRWLTKINTDLETLYSKDSKLTRKEDCHLEYTSKHKYNNSSESFTMHHFWIDLTS